MIPFEVWGKSFKINIQCTDPHCIYIRSRLWLKTSGCRNRTFHSLQNWLSSLCRTHNDIHKLVVFDRFCLHRIIRVRRHSSSPTLPSTIAAKLALSPTSSSNNLWSLKCGLMNFSFQNLMISIVESLNFGSLAGSRKQWRGIHYWLIHQNY